MRGIKTLCLGLVLLAGAAGAATPHRLPPGKKLIEWGWDEPGPAFMREHCAEMDRVGFDGVIFHADAMRNGQTLNFAWHCWGQTEFQWADFQRSYEDLLACKFQRLTHNFLRFNVCPGDVDWFDDHGMAIVFNNAQLAARLARQTGCKGFMFDVEMYHKQLFSYPEQNKLHPADWSTYEAKVRERGRQFIQAINSEFPDIVLMLTFGYSITGAPEQRAQAGYGLLKPFLDGIFEGAARQTIIVDGYEGAYPFRKYSQFVQARRIIKEEMHKVTGVPAKYRRHIRAAFGLWLDMDWRRYGWHTDPAEFERNYFTPEEFAYAVFCALAVTDEYVWIYTEQPRWWTHERLPLAYRRALREARRPHIIDDSRMGLREIKGQAGGAARVPVAAEQPGYDDKSTFGDLEKQFLFLADLPKIWRFRLDPQNLGERERWFLPTTTLDDWQSLEIGKFWDEQGIRHIGYAWYRLDWDTPAFSVPKGKDLWLWFGAVDETAVVYVNGKKAGEHRLLPDVGWNKRFAIRVTKLLRPGARNVIVVRVGNTTLAGGIWKSVKLAVER